MKEEKAKKNFNFFKLIVFFGLLSQNLDADSKDLSDEVGLFRSLDSKKFDLTHAENRCLKKNRDLLASRLQERSARMSYLQSISAFLPAVDLSRGWVKLNGLPRANEHQISFTQVLLAPELSIKKSQKRLEWCRAALEKVAVENRLLLLVRTAYFTCVLRRANEIDQLNRVRLMQSSLNREQSRLRVGQATKLEVNQVQTALCHALSDYLTCVQAGRAAKDQLAEYLGFDESDEGVPEVLDAEICPEKLSFLKGKLKPLPKDFLFGDHENRNKIDPIEEMTKKQSLFAENAKDLIIAQALQYQPAMQLAKIELAMSRLAIKEKKSRYLPNVAAGCARNNIEYPMGTLLNGRQRWQAQIDVTWRLFDGLGRERGLRSSQLNMRAIEYQIIKKRCDLRRKICERLFSIEVKFLAYSAARLGALVAEQALTLAKERYRLGEITALDFRQSANQLLHANVQKQSAGFDSMIAYFELCSDCADEQQKELGALSRLMERA